MLYTTSDYFSSRGTAYIYVCVQTNDFSALFPYMMQSKSLAKYYLQEAKWSNESFVPRLKEHLEVSIMSSGFQPLAIVALMGMSDVATKRVFDWAIGYPDEMKAGAAISRFLNDIASYKVGNKLMER
jgi:hypothetical protein